MIGKHIVLTLVVSGAIGALLWQHPPMAWTALPVTGVCLMIVGFVFRTVARFQLGASFAVKAVARRLVTHGLYSKIRNPIYVFGSCVIAGGILVFGKPLWLLIFLLVIPLQIWRAGKESAVPESAFGGGISEVSSGDLVLSDVLDVIHSATPGAGAQNPLRPLTRP